MTTSPPPAPPANPAQVQAWLQQALALHQQGQLPQAEGFYARVLQAQPRHPDALHYFGVLCLQTGRLDEGIQALCQALAHNERQPSVQLNLGNALSLAGRHGEALACYDQAVRLVPGYAEAHSNRANALRELGRPADALASADTALRLQPAMAEAHNIRGNALRDLYRLPEALASYQRALTLAPQYTQALLGRGMAHAMARRHEEAIADFRRVIELEPTLAAAHGNLGLVLQESGRHDEAARVLQEALARFPDQAELHGNLGVVHQEQGRAAEAIACFRQALALRPGLLPVHSNLLFTLTYAPGVPPEAYLQEARRYGEQALARATPFKAWPACRHDAPPGPLRVGLVSGDLRQHAVGLFLLNVLPHLDPQRIALHAYPTHVLEDDLTARLRPLFAKWSPIAADSDEAAARRIHADGVHVLVDLSGHTADNRLPVFAWKPAPVQVSWLGYLASTGVPGMDHLLADPVTVPPAHEAHFSEHVWRLPDTVNCFAPPAEDPRLDVRPPPALARGHVTFGTFQNPAKLDDALLRVWARVLQAVPDAHLRVQNRQMDHEAGRLALQARLAQAGLPAERVDLHGSTPARVDHLAQHREVDIILDTSPYNGITTTCEALWMGVPTLTLAGGTLLSRQGASLMTCAGLPDWVATSEDDLVLRAARHAGDLPALARLRAGLRAQVLASPLFDGPRLAGQLADAWEAMWEARRPALEVGQAEGDGSTAAS